MATRRSKRQSKGSTSVVEADATVKAEGQPETVREEMVRTVEDAPTERKGVEVQDEQVSQTDTVIVVKGSESTVTLTWDKKNEEGEPDETEKGTSASEPADTDVQMDTVTEENESTPAVTVTEEKKEEEGESEEDVNKETDGEGGEVVAEVKSGKRKIDSTETSPSKKTKLMNDGFSLYVGNLNNSKTFEEIKDALANHFMAQSLLVQDIKLDRSRKHAHVDLASQMDLTKALTLNSQMMLGKPMKIAKAKVKSENKVKSKVPVEDQKAARDAKCLFLKNIPYSATKEDILKIFGKAVTVRFPEGAEGPTTGIAFVEFESKAIAEKVRQKKKVAQIQGRILIVDSVGTTNGPKVTKENDNNSKAAVLPNNNLFVSGLSFKVKEKQLKKVFQKALNISIPQSKGKPKGFAFVEFATVEDAEKALQSSKNIEISKMPIKVQFSERPARGKVQSKTLMVSGLAEKTTAETLKSAFDGALSARVILDKETGVSKRFGFVDFESEENSKAVKEAMEDCEIDGSQVTLAYARPKSEKGDKQGLSGGRAGAQPAGREAARGGKARGGKARGGKGPGPRMSKYAVKKK
ncbi:nucleolin [Labrus bergylta]|uniref:nucleolin n=1 Tax=Labrus bergylta TaxID=56723 RepID=UPI003313A560